MRYPLWWKDKIKKATPEDGSYSMDQENCYLIFL